MRGTYWEDFPQWTGQDVKDWSHGNAVSYDPSTDVLLAGLRHQDAVVGLARATGGDVQWILAPPANWGAAWAPLLLQPAGPGDVQPYHMHGAKFTPAGTIVLFDNGNNRASAYEPPVSGFDNYSRAMEIAVDPVARTWRTVWTFGEDLVPPQYSGSLGDVDVLVETDHVLVTFGNVADPDRRGPHPRGDGARARSCGTSPCPRERHHLPQPADAGFVPGL
ncbi:MAG: aryl-sulfate sulfotransferase [Myxococcota bacterium]